MAQFRILLAAVTTALILPATALGQAMPDRVCTAQDIAEARAGTYTGPACRFSADEVQGAVRVSAQAPVRDRLGGAPPRHGQIAPPAQPRAVMVPARQTASVRASQPPQSVSSGERVVLRDDFFTGSLAGGVEQPGFRPVYAYRGLILIDAAGRVQTGFAGTHSTLTRQVRSLDRLVITAPVITPARAYPYN